ncbi:20772_t:CDS:2 [Cetraspora pellucida]|uniref:20772_t:CDS:1 n=1 Tax=Cetraspora pellucida TaxID=1433469 RepID=A0A9N9B7B4_9GLOM|nr:20772_t:CDS:2 [Cetraspora pellucida]
MTSLIPVSVFNRLPLSTIPPSIQSLCQMTILVVFIPFIITISVCLSLCDIVTGIYGKNNNPPNANAKVILITGASSGIGAAIALEYAKPGVTLGLLGRNEERLNQIFQRCKDKGAECVMLKVDISNTMALIKMLEYFDDKHPIDLLFANAAQVGVTRDDSDTVEWEDAWKRFIEVNYMGNICTVMTVYKRMKERNFGQIAIISSAVGFFGPPNMCWYNSTKCALNSFARDLRYIVEPYNIRVSLVTPGIIASNMTTNPDQPVPFTNSSLANPNELAKVIKKQLESNVFCIAWPFFQVLLAWLGSTFPPRVSLMVSWAFGKLFQIRANDLALT